MLLISHTLRCPRLETLYAQDAGVVLRSPSRTETSYRNGPDRRRDSVVQSAAGRNPRLPKTRARSGCCFATRPWSTWSTRQEAMRFPPCAGTGIYSDIFSSAFPVRAVPHFPQLTLCSDGGRYQVPISDAAHSLRPWPDTRASTASRVPTTSGPSL